MKKGEKKYNEETLINRLQDASSRHEAFSDLVNIYSEQLYWHIRRMVLIHEDADDLLQNTFIKAWNNIEKFRGDSRLSTWLYRIAINETLTFLNSRHSDTISLNSSEGTIAEQLESDTYFDGNHADALFHEAVSKLPEKQRLVFNMKYFEEMKYEDISEIMGTSVGALKASYHIAVKKLSNYLENND